MQNKKKVLIKLRKEDRSWIFVQKIRSEGEFEWNDLVCFCYPKLYVKLRIEKNKTIIVGEFKIRMWEENNEKKILILKNKAGLGRWEYIYLVHPIYSKKFKPIIKYYAKTK